MTVRHVLTRRWVGAAGLLTIALLVGAIALHAVGNGPAPSAQSVLPAGVALFVTGLVLVAGATVAGSRRTPYW